jgi:hypothetical protein
MISLEKLLQQILAVCPSGKTTFTREEATTFGIGLEALHSYIQKIGSLYQPHIVAADDFIPVLAEQLPDNLDQLNLFEDLLNRLNDLVSNSTLKNKGENTFDISTLAIGLSHKQAILRGEAKSLKQEIVDLQHREKVTNKEAVKSVRDDLAFFERAQGVIVKLEGLTYEKKLDRITGLISMYQEVMHTAPAFITNYSHGTETLPEFFDNLKEQHAQLTQEMRESITLKSDAELEKNITLCESRAIDGIPLLCNAIAIRLKALTPVVPPEVHDQLSNDFYQLTSTTSFLIHPEKHIDAYSDILAKAKTNFQNTIQHLVKAPYLDVTHAYREVEKKVDKELREALPPGHYPYLITGRDLRRSENIFISAMVESNPLIIENKDKFILSLDKTNGLYQICKDCERNLKLEGEEFKNTNQDEMKDKLISLFKEENTENLIKHFDQAVSLMVCSPVIKAATSPSDDPMTSITANGPSEYFEQNLYLKNDVLYRDVAISNLVITVPEDEDPLIQARNGQWLLKVEAKVVSWVSKDGFVVDGIGCDSAMIANSYMNKDVSEDFKHLVKVILAAQELLGTKLRKLEGKKLDRTPHKAEINVASKLIDTFKAGGLSFDRLVERMQDHVINLKVGHASLHGKFFKAVRKTGTEKKLKSVLKSLEAAKQRFDGNASALLRVPTSPAPPPDSQRLRSR